MVYFAAAALLLLAGLVAMLAPARRAAAADALESLRHPYGITTTSESSPLDSKHWSAENTVRPARAEHVGEGIQTSLNVVVIDADLAEMAKRTGSRR
jgi:hypothetical protein